MHKVFIIGLPRTGTTSISVALLDYGFKVAHTAYTKQAFALAEVISDSPCFSDYQQLDKLFPEAKFIYLERDLSLWVPSMQMLLGKMLPSLEPKTGVFNPVLKRSFNEVFKLSSTENPHNERHLTECYLTHKQAVVKYFGKRDDLLTIDVSHKQSLRQLLDFLGIGYEGEQQFPHLNAGRKVACWKEYKHPNKVNSNAAGVEQRKFFNYGSI